MSVCVHIYTHILVNMCIHTMYTLVNICVLCCIMHILHTYMYITLHNAYIILHNAFTEWKIYSYAELLSYIHNFVSYFLLLTFRLCPMLWISLSINLIIPLAKFLEEELLSQKI